MYTTTSILLIISRITLGLLSLISLYSFYKSNKKDDMLVSWIFSCLFVYFVLINIYSLTFLNISLVSITFLSLYVFFKDKNNK